MEILRVILTTLVLTALTSSGLPVPQESNQEEGISVDTLAQLDGITVDTNEPGQVSVNIAPQFEADQDDVASQMTVQNIDEAIVPENNFEEVVDQSNDGGTERQSADEGILLQSNTEGNLLENNNEEIIPQNNDGEILQDDRGLSEINPNVGMSVDTLVQIDQGVNNVPEHGDDQTILEGVIAPQSEDEVNVIQNNPVPFNTLEDILPQNNHRDSVIQNTSEGNASRNQESDISEDTIAQILGTTEPHQDDVNQESESQMNQGAIASHVSDEGSDEEENEGAEESNEEGQEGPGESQNGEEDNKRRPIGASPSGADHPWDHWHGHHPGHPPYHVHPPHYGHPSHHGYHPYHHMKPFGNGFGHNYPPRYWPNHHAPGHDRYPHAYMNDQAVPRELILLDPRRSSL